MSLIFPVVDLQNWWFYHEVANFWQSFTVVLSTLECVYTVPIVLNVLNSTVHMFIHTGKYW